MFINRYTTIALAIAVALAGRQFFGMATAPVKKTAFVVVADLHEKQLIKACEAGNFETVKALLADHPDINVNADYGGISALMVASQYPEIADYLIAHGACIDAHCLSGLTALMWVAFNGHLERVIYLVEHGATVNASDEEDTALTLACVIHSMPIIKYLIEHGADVNACNSEALRASIDSHPDNPTGLETIKYLVNKGADINAQSKCGATAVRIAVQENRLDILEYLVSLGVKADSPAFLYPTPLMRAAERRNLAMVQLLVQGGANIFAQDRYGKTALDYAQKSSPEIGAYLAPTMAKRQALFALLACEDLINPPHGTNEDFPPELIDRVLKPLITTTLTEK